MRHLSIPFANIWQGLGPIGFNHAPGHPSGSAVLRNGYSNCRRVCRALGAEIPSRLPSARLRSCHQYTARRSDLLLLTGSIDSLFPATGPPHFPPEMTNAMIRSMMEACIMCRRVGNSRLFASSPKSRNEASGVNRPIICPWLVWWCVCSK